MLTAAGVHPKTVQEIMRHSDINLTMGTYTHLQDSDKAKAVGKLPPIRITKKKQAKTGTCDTPEDQPTVNSTVNPVKIRQNAVKSSKRAIEVEVSRKAVTPCKTNSLQRVKSSRPAGLEPAAYGLEIRCSIQLSYGRFKLKVPQYNNFQYMTSIIFLRQKGRFAGVVEYPNPIDLYRAFGFRQAEEKCIFGTTFRMICRKYVYEPNLLSQRATAWLHFLISIMASSSGFSISSIRPFRRKRFRM